MPTISNTPRPGYVYDSTDNVWYPIGTGPHTHSDYITQATAINPTIVDAKGDIIAATAADTVARLAVGANDTVLTADSSTATGLKWATPSSGGMTLINTGGTTLTGSSITISSIPGTYKNLQLVIRNFLPATNNQSIRMRLNGVTTTTYAADAVDANDVAAWNNEITPGGNSSNSVSNSLIYATITDYTNTTTYKMVEMQGITTNATTTANINYRTNMGWFYNTNAITSITLFPNSGNFTSGTAFLYGVS